MALLRFLDRIMLLIFLPQRTQRKNAKSAKTGFNNNLVASFAKPFATLAVKKTDGFLGQDW